MKKEDATEDKDIPTDMIATDPDPVQVGADSEALEIEVDDTSEVKAEESAVEPEAAAEDESPPEKPPAKDDKQSTPKPRRSWFGLFNFLLILALAGAAGYYWWLEQQVKQRYQNEIADLRAELGSRARQSDLASVDGNLDSLRTDLGALKNDIGTLNVEQENLRQASEKLYELYGRDKNDWQLAEVEYLMRIAQHRLILQHDFEGAAVTLQAASDRIALTGDPGLLPVRVMISNEIADLKTRKRPDLVGATLILAQLARQAVVLEPGFARRVDETADSPAPADSAEADWLERFNRFIDSLVEVRHESLPPTEIEASVDDVGETLADNLKLARWAVLDRDQRQYAKLIDQALRLLREFYDLDNAANNDFFNQLQELQKMQLSPDKPDIGGSLRELQRILSQRENAPQQESEEPVDG